MNFSNRLLNSIKYIALILFLGFSCSFAQNSSPTTVSLDESNSIRTPIFLGASLGFGSGTGVNSSKGLGLYEVKPIIGAWLPGFGFIRFGYSFFDFYEHSDDDENYDIEHTNFDIEVGIHILGQFYIMGTYSRVKELSDLGDLAWNEWGAGFGSLLNLFGKSFLIGEVNYRFVLEHFDPFINKDISGSRLQFNFGFVTYVF